MGILLCQPARKSNIFFSELYDLPERIYLPYFKLKVQELLLFLDMLDLENTKRLNQYVSGQVETIKEIHSLMTSDIKRHYTIEELSKQYLMNTTTADPESGCFCRFKRAGIICLHDPWCPVQRHQPIFFRWFPDPWFHPERRRTKRLIQPASYGGCSYQRDHLYCL